MRTVLESYPWLRDGWLRLQAYLDSGRVPQALLMTGPAGIGKRQLALLLAQRLLCREPGEFGCGHCASCSLFAAGTHPDLLQVAPAERGKPITVDAIRGLIAALALKPQYSGHRVVILAPAHQMNVNAANSLLKTLEEPERHTVMLLLSEQPAVLPATIASRCQRFALGLPDKARVLDFLAGQGYADRAEVLWGIAGGAPLRALQVAETAVVETRAAFFGDWAAVAAGREQPVAVAEKWAKAALDDLADWMVSWTGDLIRLKSAPNCPRLDNPDVAANLQAMAARLHLTGIFEQFDGLIQARRLLAGQVNRQLLLEQLLIRWAWLAR